MAGGKFPDFTAIKGGVGKMGKGMSGFSRAINRHVDVRMSSVMLTILVFVLTIGVLHYILGVFTPKVTTTYTKGPDDVDIVETEENTDVVNVVATVVLALFMACVANVSMKALSADNSILTDNFDDSGMSTKKNTKNTGDSISEHDFE